jgi:hypothetical protein
MASDFHQIVSANLRVVDILCCGRTEEHENEVKSVVEPARSDSCSLHK